MKVTRETPDQLIVEEVPWGIAIGLVLFILFFAAVGLFLLSEGVWMGLIFLLGGGGLGFGALWAFVRRVQLILDRVSGAITLRERTLFGMTEERHPLAELQGAEVAQRTSRNREGRTRRTARVELLMGAHRLPLTEVYSSGRHHLRVARAINDWLDSGRDAA
jgi:hypothetical protein